jgi:hypothetical protein
MITLTREEAQQVLKVLEYPGPSWPESRTELAVALRYKLSAPERAWQGLTEQEHANIAVEAGCASADWVFYGAAVERALKEKNR